MEWIVAFDLMEEGFRLWWFGPLFLLTFGLLGLVIIRYRGKIASLERLAWLVEKFTRRQLTPIMVMRFGQIYLGAAIISCIVVFLFTYSRHSNLERAYENSDYVELEGSVRNFVPALSCVSGTQVSSSIKFPAQLKGVSVERFSLKGTEFAYSNYHFIGGFDHTVPCGGPMREGLFVRLRHFNGVILRLEVRQQPNP